MIFNFIISILLAIIGVLYIAYGLEQYRQEEMNKRLRIDLIEKVLPF